jgi:pSer/pThr/pTyr-binding forkhead associated (FHA) protein
MGARLELVLGHRVQNVFPLDPARQNLVGRDESCDVCLRYSSVSSRHCQVERRSSGWYVVDLNSTNGTRVRGALIRESALECGDEIGVSRRVTLRFMITVAAPGGALDLDQA